MSLHTSTGRFLLYRQSPCLIHVHVELGHQHTNPSTSHLDRHDIPSHACHAVLRHLTTSNDDGLVHLPSNIALGRSFNLGADGQLLHWTLEVKANIAIANAVTQAFVTIVTIVTDIVSIIRIDRRTRRHSSFSLQGSLLRSGTTGSLTLVELEEVAGVSLGLVELGVDLVGVLAAILFEEVHAGVGELQTAGFEVEGEQAEHDGAEQVGGGRVVEARCE